VIAALALAALLLTHPAPPSAATACPVDAPVEYSNSYMIWANNRRHKGVDVYAEVGAPVVAPEDGVLKFSSNSKGGLTAYLYAPGGVRYYFAHLAFQKIGAHLGWDYDGYVPIEAGALIGGVGYTGNASSNSPHLHYEKRIDGSRVNPWADLEKTCRP
jgi:murein DD-endopeptidase MepM/ murein hydrolase activator NlpD